MPKAGVEEMKSKYVLRYLQMWLIIKYIYIYFFPADGDKLLKQLTELQDYCKSCKKQPFTPKLGEACCARFSGEGIFLSYASLTSVKCFSLPKKEQNLLSV